MSRIKIKTESLAKRCDICHKSDGFSAEKNYCSRCKTLENNILLEKDSQQPRRLYKQIVLLVSLYSTFYIVYLLFGETIVSNIFRGYPKNHLFVLGIVNFFILVVGFFSLSKIRIFIKTPNIEKNRFIVLTELLVLIYALLMVLNLFSSLLWLLFCFVGFGYRH